ncbi:MAG: alpha-galactosidase [Christensenellales bacterium]|jgi:alpha-galactosidase
MIRFCDGVFHVRSKGASYLMKIAKNGVLLHLYWGKRLPDGDYSALEPKAWGAASFDNDAGRAPFELPTQEAGYFGKRAVECVNGEGDDVVSLRFKSYEIVRGKKALDGLPSSYCEEDDGCETLEITLIDELTGLEAVLSYSASEKFDIIARTVRFANRGKEALTLGETASASVILPGDAYDAIHLHGAWIRERDVYRAPLAHMTARVESRRGASGHEESPFMALCEHCATEFSGKVYGMTWVYSGSFFCEANVDNFGRTRLSIGLNGDVFRWKLGAGETFQMPEALLAFSDCGLNGMSRAFHEYIRLRVCRGVWRDEPRPILINNWEATYFAFTPEKLHAIAENASKLGIELFVLDDGWFGKRNIDNCSLGDWVCNTEKLPNGIRGVAEDINSLGMKFGLWFEPEMISPDSDLYRAHPDWCLHVDGRPRTEMRSQLILDMSRREVQDYVIDALKKVLEDAPIDYVKWDMNRNMTEAFSGVLPKENKLETQHRYMLGLYRVLDEITQKLFPNVLFESCSGGGGRFDAGMLCYMAQTWTSDNTDANDRVKIQYSTSFVYPPCTMCAHVSATPNHQTGRTSSMRTRGDVAMSGNFGYQLDLSKLSQEDLEEVAWQVERGKKVRDLVQKGAYTRLLSPFEGNAAAWQFARENEALLFVYQRMVKPNSAPFKVYMRELDENALYESTDGKTYSGAELMYIGLDVLPARHDFESLVLHFVKK